MINFEPSGFKVPDNRTDNIRQWNQMTNKEKVLFYEKQLEKYAENGAKCTVCL